jgi:hypothetical protein
MLKTARKQLAKVTPGTLTAAWPPATVGMQSTDGDASHNSDSRDANSSMAVGMPATDGMLATLVTSGTGVGQQPMIIS